MWSQSSSQDNPARVVATVTPWENVLGLGESVAVAKAGASGGDVGRGG